MTCAAAWLAVALAGTADAMPASAVCSPPTLPAQAVAGEGRAASGAASLSVLGQAPRSPELHRAHDGEGRRASVVAQAPRSPELPRARDGEAAIREEYDAARRAGTREAYDLFIARHPDHPLARTMQEERERPR